MKTNQLFTRALFVSQGNEKNSLIQELHEAFDELNAKVIEAKRVNQEKQELLQKHEKDLQEKIVELDNIKKMKAFVDLYKSTNLHEIAHNYIRSINDTYKLISIYDDDHKKQPIRAADYNCINIQTVLKLLDENTNALEDLSYALNKRRIVLLEGNSVFDIITKEYGSVNELNLKYRSLLVENTQLSKIESRSNKDSFVRRLNLSKATNNTLRNLSVFFNMEYQSKKCVSEILERRISVSRKSSDRRSNGSQTFLGVLYPQELDIEDLLNDKAFSTDPYQDLTQYQGTNAIPPQNIEAAVSYVTKEIGNIEEEYARLNDQVYSIKDPIFKVNDNPVTNADKYESVANSLFRQMGSQRNILDFHNDEIEELISEIKNVMDEKGKLEREAAKLYEPIQRFTDDHIKKLELLNHNNEIVSILFHTCCSLGIELDRKEKIETPIKTHISTQLKEMSIICKDIPSEQATPNTIIRAIRNQKKIVRPNGNSVPIHPHPIPAMRSKNRIPDIPKPVEAMPCKQLPKLECELRFANFHRLLTTDRIYRGSEQSGLVKDAVDKMMKKSYGEAMRGCRESIEMFGVWQRAKLMKLRALNSKILQCEKCCVEVQTEGRKSNENGCQCDPADFPKPQKRGK